MAEKTNRLPQNTPGPYYVDESCIDCDLCRTTAPDFFRLNSEIGFSVVYRQPVTPEDRVLVEEARQSCPTESIGNDGEDVLSDSIFKPKDSYPEGPCASAKTGCLS